MRGKKARLARVLARNACNPNVGFTINSMGNRWGRHSYRWFIKQIKRKYRDGGKEPGLRKTRSLAQKTAGFPI